jgi:hypothetical protein
MKRTWTIIGVGDGASSLKWYQSLFGHPRTPPDHDDFGQILDTDGTVLLCLHQWGAHGIAAKLRRPELIEASAPVVAPTRHLDNHGFRDQR